MTMNQAVGCFCSAVIGAVVALAMIQNPPGETALAQEPVVPRGPAFPGNSDVRKAGVPLAPSGLQPEPDFDTTSLSPEERINVAVYEKVNKSVVHMMTKGVRADAVLMFDMAVEGAGSGSILDKAGHILTNYHVIEDARQVSVTLYDGKSYDARFVGADPVNDVCVIRIDAPPESLHPVTFGDSGKLKVGMRVFAIGNPFGLERTLTTGIISSLNRSLQIHNNRTIKSIIQIDAAINPGNSGGPLLDTRARLIGMNTAIASRTGQNSGVGFAIPVSLIARIVPQLIERGQVIRPEIGIARVFETERGLLIAKVTPGGPAERAGLRGPAVTTRKRGPFVVESVDRSAADLIIAVDGEQIKTADDFLSHIEAKRAGDTVTLSILRQGREMQVAVQLVSSVEPPAPTPRTR